MLLPAAITPAIAAVSIALVMPLMLALRTRGRAFPEALWLVPLLAMVVMLPWPLALVLLTYPALALASRWIPLRSRGPSPTQLTLLSRVGSGKISSFPRLFAGFT